MNPLKKITRLPLLLVLVFAISVAPTIQVKATDSVNIGLYHSFTFYGKSAPEPIPLAMDTDSVSVLATCEGEEIDHLTAHIRAMDDSGFELDIPFEADGYTKTYPYHIPAGEYWVNITGSSHIAKDSYIIFSVVN